MTAPSTLVTPRRIQLSRVKGWRLAAATSNPNGVVKVDRTTKWGNPFVVHRHTVAGCGSDLVDCPLRDDQEAVDSADFAVGKLRHVLLYPCQNDPWYPSLGQIRGELAGRDLACWCHPDSQCHADLLIELANTPEVTR